MRDEQCNVRAEGDREVLEEERGMKEGWEERGGTGREQVTCRPSLRLRSPSAC